MTVAAVRTADVRFWPPQASSPEVKELRAEAAALKEALADVTLENRLLKKSMIGGGGDQE